MTAADQLSIFTMPYVRTRARSSDSDTSHDAAKAAVSRKADRERAAITEAIKDVWHGNGLTAREVASFTGIDYITVQRRISECGLTKTTERRDGCAVWVAVV